MLDFTRNEGDPGSSPGVGFGQRSGARHEGSPVSGASDRAAVDGFYGAAIAPGGKDNGPPGLRPYHETYYAAYVHDADGNNIEAVTHRPE